MKNGEEIMTTTQNEIDAEIRKYYKSLYSCKDNLLTFDSINDFMSDDLPLIEYKKLTNFQARQLEGEITEAEVMQILKIKQKQYFSRHKRFYLLIL